MVNNTYARPVIPLLMSLISGIIAGNFFPNYDIWSYLIIIIGFIFLLAGLILKKNTSIFPLIFFTALGYLSIQPWVTPRFPDNHVIHFADSTPRQIIGTIDSPPMDLKNRLRFYLKIESLGKENRSFPAAGKIMVSVWGKGPALSAGNRLMFKSKIKKIRNFNNPGRFDYKRYMTFKKIWGTAHVSSRKLTILAGGPAIIKGRIIEKARKKITGLIEKTPDGEQKGVYKALIVGDRNDISPAVRKAFNRAGAGHLLAISGLHIGIVATVAFVFFRWLFSYIPPLLRHAWTRKGAAMATLIPILVYGLLAGMSPSTQRAVIMATAFLLTFLIEREADPFNILATAAMIILVFNPPSLFSISFQLSFTAVLFIIYGVRWLQHTPLSAGGHFHILNRFLSFVMVSFFAILGTLPLVMYYFNQVSLIGLFANVLLIPLIGFVVIPLGLAAVFIYPLTINAASWLLGIGSFVLSQALDIVHFFADLPFAALKTITPSLLEIACFYILLWSAFNLKKNRTETSLKENLPPEAETVDLPAETSDRLRKQPWKRKTMAFSRQKLLRIIALTTILVAIVDTGYWTYNRFWHKDLRVTVIDVGQGSAALVEMPKGYTLLIDGGGFSGISTFDVGARIVAPLLWNKKIRTVDTLILSHPNSDHLNGLLYIAEHFNVKQIWTNSQVSNTLGFRKFMEITEVNKIHMPDYKDLSRNHEINGAILKILYPPRNFLEKEKRLKHSNLNDNSMVVQIQLGTKKILFPGDIMARGEQKLAAAAGDGLKSTVLIAPHHGSRNSSSDLFLESVKPELVVISAGWKNRFKFPHPSVVEKYRTRRFRVYRTDLDGAVTITSDGRNLAIKTYLETPGR